MIINYPLKRINFEKDYILFPVYHANHIINKKEKSLI